MSESTGNTILTVGRAADVLSLFTRRPEPTLGVTEISKELGLSKAVVHRILSTLVEKNYIQMDTASRRYALGSEALRLGLSYLDRVDIRRLAVPVLHRLVADTEETSTLSIRTGWTRVYIDQVTPPTDVKMSVQVGHPYPLHAGSSSKALLAFLDPDEQEAYIGQRELARHTSTTITDPTALRAELARIRERGFARSSEERQQGAASVAAPVLDRDGRPVASVSICGPLQRFEPKADASAELLLTAVQELSAQLGHR